MHDKNDDRQVVIDTIHRILNSDEQADYMNEAFIMRGFEVVIYVNTIHLITSSDLNQIEKEDRQQVEKFIAYNLDKIREDYQKKNNHRLDGITLKGIIPTLINAWQRGERSDISSKISLPLPTSSSFGTHKSYIGEEFSSDETISSYPPIVTEDTLTKISSSDDSQELLPIIDTESSED